MKPKLVPKCINLQDRFGRQYRVGYEESYYAQYGPNATTVDPWYMEIRCQNGTIGPWGGDDLVACTKSAGPVAQALKALPFARVHQDGSDGANVVFPLERFDEVATIMRPRRKRCHSEVTREKLARTWFKTGRGLGDGSATPQTPALASERPGSSSGSISPSVAF